MSERRMALKNAGFAQSFRWRANRRSRGRAWLDGGPTLSILTLCSGAGSCQDRNMAK